MAWNLKGTYALVCSCQEVCPCSFDGPPSGPEGACRGVNVFHIDQGNLDETDLSGVNFALYNYFPKNLSAGNVKLEVVVDESASEAQVQALAKILSGQEGGPFADLAALVTEVVGPTKAKVTFSGGKTPGGSVGKRSDFKVDLYLGGDGNATVVTNAMFGFAPAFKIGKGSGKSDVLGQQFQPIYGETADFDYSDKAAEVHAR